MATATGAAAIVPARSAAATAAAVDGSTAVGLNKPSAEELKGSPESPPTTARVPSMGAEGEPSGAARDMTLVPPSSWAMLMLLSFPLLSWVSALFSEEVAESERGVGGMGG